MTSKISMLQRQQAFQRDAINTEHKLVKVCKDQIKWLKGVPDIASTQKRIDVLYKCVEASQKRIAKLVEMQKFTKGQLQEAYNTIELSKWEQLGTWQRIESYFDDLNCADNLPERVGIDGTKYEWQIPTSEFLWNNAPGGIWHKAAQERVAEYKHNPKFMDQAPAAEVGSLIGEEL